MAQRVQSSNPDHSDLISQLNRVFAAYEQRIAALEAATAAIGTSQNAQVATNATNLANASS